MGVLVNQNDFSHGELEPRMLSKSNLQLYRKAAQRLRNVVVLPTGGLQRRFGTLFIEDHGSATNEIMLAEFIFDEDTPYLLLFTNLSLTVYENDGAVATKVTVWPGSVLANNELNFSQTENSMIITHPDYQPYELSRGASSAIWNLNTFSFKNYPGEDFKQNYDAINFNLDVVAIGPGRTLTASSAVFDAGYVGGWFESFGKETLEARLGVAKITGYTDSTHVTVEITSEFDSNLTAPVSGAHCFLTEPAFSAARGWPRSVTFYEGRLYFGGSKSLPDTIFGSVVGEFRNFDVGTGQADDALQMTIGGHKVGIIQHILGDKSLQIFTSRGEYTALQTDGRALKPGAFSIKKQSSNGIENVRPLVLDNQTFYAKNGGKGIMNFVFDNDRQAFTSTEVSLLSPHLIIQPLDGAVLSGSTRDNADFLFIINTDGTLATYQSRMSENVSAWTLCNTAFQTDGKFLKVTEMDDDIYFIVQRTVNSVDKIYLEKLSFDNYTDSAFTNTYGVPTDVITGLGHLEGEEVRVRGDGYVLGNETVSSGQITIDREVSEIEVGLKFQPLIKPMPLAIDTRGGNTMYRPKKIIAVYIDYYESLGIYIDGILIPPLTFGPTVLDQPPTVKTGIYELLGMLRDWSPRDMIEITQEEPLAMTIIGIGFEVSA